ncbi:MAG: GAF domain-containing protein [Xenococcaceae cyanobacterium]
MVAIKLKRLIAKKEVSSLLNEMIEALGVAMGIQDAEGKRLMGNDADNSLEQYPIELEGEVIGWVSGEKKASPIAALLTYIANRELEQKNLARETLDKYREINLLYKIAGKLTANLGVKEVAQIVIDEAKEFIKATRGSVQLLDEEESQLEILATFGPEYDRIPKMQPIEGIVRSVILTGTGEIVNEVLSDPRFVPHTYPISSLICVPLQTKDEVIGIILVSHERTVLYKASDLKLLSALASQATSAITNAIFYENMLREERVRSNLARYF